MTETKTIKKPKILFFDLETSHSLMASFQLYDVNIPYSNILTEWAIISVAWKWKGDKKTYSLASDIKKGQVFADIDDKQLIEEFVKVLEEADIVVGHNIDKFDIKKFKARMVFHGLAPLKKLTTIDTLKVARKEFSFTSNRLDYLAQLFGFPGKMHTPTGLWLDVLRADQKAIKTMVKYNVQDVVVLEDVYDRLLPYISNHPNVNVFLDSSQGTSNCPNCGSSKLHKHGFRVNKQGKYQRYACQDCGANSRGRSVEIKKPLDIVPE